MRIRHIWKAHCDKESRIRLACIGVAKYLFSVRLALLLLIPLIMATEVVHAHGMSIAAVDAGKIFSHWDYTISFEDKAEKLSKSLEENNQERLAVIKELAKRQQDMAANYQKGKVSMSAEEKAAMDKSFKNLGRELKALEQNRVVYMTREQEKLSKLKAETSKSILVRIQKEISIYAKQQNFDMVIEMQGHTTRNLPFFLHLEGAVDITDTIILRLNQSHQDKLPK